MSLDYLTSPLLEPFRHGFFLRRGGKSEGVYGHLNCGLHTQDNPKNVRYNRSLVAHALGIEPQNLFTAYQMHSAKVTTIDHPLPKCLVKVDGLVTKSKSIALGVLTADCQPILFADKEAGVIGAAHAGWRGTLAGIIENTVAAMLDQGARRDCIRAVIGPTISQEKYEVGPEFREEFLYKDPKSQHFFGRNSHGQLVFDLPQYGMIRLHRARIQRAACLRHCTYSDPANYFSYRRNCHEGQPATGLLISVITAQTNLS